MTGDVPAPLVARNDIFPVPVFVYRWPEADRLNPELAAAILKRCHATPGRVATNVGGWHSEYDVPEWPEPAFGMVLRWATATVATVIATWRPGPPAPPPPTLRVMNWANVNPPHGARNRSHHHIRRDWHWTAVYYVQTPRATVPAGGCGDLVFEDRFAGIDLAQRAREDRRVHRHHPRPGELVVFPAWIYHSVDAHDDDVERISIGFNFHSPMLEDSRYWAHRKSALWKAAPWLMRPLARLYGSWDQSDPGGPPGYDVSTAWSPG
jgi:uncharacterized protein (TIGR02466 family)